MVVFSGKRRTLRPRDSMIQRLTGVSLAMVVLGGLATGCSRPRSLQSSSPAGADNPQVLAADGVLCDLTRTLATPAITVDCVLSGEDDPHRFSLSPQQRSDLEEADLVLINGLGLTPGLARLAEEGEAVAVGETIELQPSEASMEDGDDHDDHDDNHHDDHHDDHDAEATASQSLDDDDHNHGEHHGDGDHHDDHHGHDHGSVDPHVWHNPEQTQAMAMVITEELIKLVPEDATALRALNQEAIAVLKDLDSWTRRQVATIPPEQKVLATSHQAFGYYAQRYGFRQLPLRASLSTVEGIRPAVLSNLRRELAENNVVVLFPEHSPPSQSLLVLSQQSGIPLSPQHLIADGLAPGKSTVETFVTNTCAITNGLQGQCDEAAGEDLVNRWGMLADQ